MKKQHRIKLVLNSQTIRRLHAPGLKEVQGGYRQIVDTADDCVSDACTGGCPTAVGCAPTANCRACG